MLKKRHFLLIIFLIFFIKLTYILTTVAGKQNPSCFHRQTKSVIKIADAETLQQAWLAARLKLKKHDINVLDEKDISKIFELFTTCPKPRHVLDIQKPTPRIIICLFKSQRQSL